MRPLKEAGPLEEGYYWLFDGKPEEHRTWLTWLPDKDWEIVYICDGMILRIIAAGVEPIDVHLLSYPDAIISERIVPPSTDNRALSADSGLTVEGAADGDLDQQR